MRINITPSSLSDPESKKELVASTFEAVNQLLTKNARVTIQINGRVKLTNLAEALRNISEIVEAGASVLQSEEKDSIYDRDPDDSADYWKDGRRGDE